MSLISVEQKKVYVPNMRSAHTFFVPLKLTCQKSQPVINLMIPISGAMSNPT